MSVWCHLVLMGIWVSLGSYGRLVSLGSYECLVSLGSYGYMTQGVQSVGPCVSYCCLWIWSVVRFCWTALSHSDRAM